MHEPVLENVSVIEASTLGDCVERHQLACMSVGNAG